MTSRRKLGEAVSRKAPRTAGEGSLADLDVVILCGGQGTRLREETQVKPKPMVEIGGRPILWHIMRIYSRFGIRSFILCLGYKGEIIRDYFLNYRYNRSDLVVDLAASSVEVVGGLPMEDWRVVLADTGEATQTGARMRMATRYVRHPRFLATYGDGVADIDVRALYDNHVAGGRKATVTAVHPAARFGEIDVKSGQVTMFDTPQVADGWVNGGFFVFDREIFDHADAANDLSLERDILPKLASRNELGAYHHDGFWQCMDTYRDMLLLNELCKSGRAPWMIGDGR
jgi:glucose-1-phosphate cytidylyltransferase